MTAAQLDLFADGAQTLVGGLAIVMPTPCRHCNGVAATIGVGRGPPSASLTCGCGRHLGWMSTGTFNFIAETVRHFGRPTEPIKVRFKTAQTTKRFVRANGAAPSGASAAPNRRTLTPSMLETTDNERRN
jgi:hypothetical protein